MGCSKCHDYSFVHRRCLLGKANPSTRKGTLETMRTMGAEYICSYNNWKGGLIRELIKSYPRTGYARRTR